MCPDGSNRSEDPLVGIAAAVADRSSIDWRELAASTDDPRTRSAIERLRLIDQIAHAHASGAPPGGSDAMPLPSPPYAWGPLQVVEQVGRGTFGDVYRAIDGRLDREVALKLLRREGPGGDAGSAVIEEARLMARLRHPNIVAIYGADRVDGRVGLWMEFVHGRTLEAELKERGPFPPAEVARIGVAIADALEAVHQAGLLHRDIKAQNVLRDRDGRTMLADFGTGRELVDASMAHGELAGTPAYLAPEVLEGAAASVSSDVYSLGVLLFHLATGTFPVRGASVRALLEAHRTGARTTLRISRPGFAARMATVIDRAIALDPGVRFGSARELASQLSKATQPHRRHALVLTTAVLTLLAAGAALWQSGSWTTTEPPDLPLGLPGQVPEPPVPSKPADIPTSVKPNVRPSGLVHGATAFTRPNEQLQRKANLLSLSADSAHAPCRPRGSNELAWCDLLRGTWTTLRARTGTGFALGAGLLSPDGRTIAYHWRPGPSSLTVRLIEIDGTNDRELTAAGTSGLDRWAANGQYLFGAFDDASGSRHVAIYPDRPLREIARSAGPGKVSPDERFVVMSRGSASNSNRDLVLLDVAAGTESVIASDPADDHSPTWTPDGRAIVFVSDRLGERAIFLVPLHNGAPGQPRVVQRVGRSTVMRIAFYRDDAIVVDLMPFWYDAFVAPLDAERASLGPAARVRPEAFDQTMGASWSPDGGSLAYIAGPFGVFDATTSARLVVKAHPAGRITELPLAGRAVGSSSARWLPDGRRIAVSYDTGRGLAIDIVDRTSERAERVLDEAGVIRWAPDGDAILYIRTGRILRHDIGTRQSTTVYDASVHPPPFRPSSFDVSARGDLAIVSTTDRRLRVLRSDKAIVDRHRFEDGCTAVSWMPDGERLLVACWRPGKQGSTLYLMGATSGDPVAIYEHLENVTDISIRADGRAVLFQAGGNQVPVAHTITGLRWAPAR